MFGWWGRAVVRARWWVLLVTAVFVTVGALWGTGVFDALAGGGFEVPNSQSSVAARRIGQTFGPLGQDGLVLYTSTDATVDEPGLADPVRAALGRLQGRPEVTQVISYYLDQDPRYVSADRHATYLALQLRPGGAGTKLADLNALAPLLQAGDGVRTEIGGIYAFSADANRQVESDLVRAELISLPILLVLLLLIFRGLVAAATPLLVGGRGDPGRVHGHPGWSPSSPRSPSSPPTSSPCSASAWRSTTRCSWSAGSGRSWPPAQTRTGGGRRAPCAPPAVPSWSPA